MTANTRTQGTLTGAWRGGNRQGYPGWTIQFRYDESVIEALKDRIPPSHRSWSKQEKTWCVAEDFESVLEQLFADFWVYKSQQTLPGF